MEVRQIHHYLKNTEKKSSLLITDPIRLAFCAVKSICIIDLYPDNES